MYMLELDVDKDKMKLINTYIGIWVKNQAKLKLFYISIALSHSFTGLFTLCYVPSPNLCGYKSHWLDAWLFNDRVLVSQTDGRALNQLIWCSLVIGEWNFSHVQFVFIVTNTWFHFSKTTSSPGEDWVSQRLAPANYIIEYNLSNCG